MTGRAGRDGCGCACRPVPCEDGIRDLEVEILPADPAPVRIIQAADRIEARITTPPNRRASLGVRAVFTVGPSLPTAGCSPEDVDLYTRPSEGLVRVSDRVAALAERLASGQSGPEAVVRRIWAFLLDDMGSGQVHYDQLDPTRPLDRVLEQGLYDCELGSALFAALCRARRIPARVVKGYVLQPAAPNFHSWAEAWLEGRGWTPVDLAAWDLSAGGRDADWRDCYFGQLGHRVATQRPPRLFSGVGDLRLPPRLAHADRPGGQGRGVVVEFRAVDTGAMVYREHIEVERLAKLLASFDGEGRPVRPAHADRARPQVDRG